MADTGTAWATGKYEWLDSNRSKSYPLADTTGGEPGTLPPSLLVDACILSDTPNVHDVYISKIEVSDVGWMLSITASYGETVTTLDRVISVAFSSEQGSEAKFLRESGDLCVAGSFTIGNPRAVSDWPPITNLSLAEGMLFPGIVHDISGQFISGIRINNLLLTGEVELVAGPGIEFETLKTDTGWELRISNTKYSIPEDNLTITTDDELLAAITSESGNRAVTTINGIRPDSEGNINIYTPISEDRNSIYVVPESIHGHTINLTISKDPCIDFTTIDKLSENLQQLNIRGSRLDDGVKALDRAINSLATQLTRIDK